jgi:hypothetical protein
VAREAAAALGGDGAHRSRLGFGVLKGFVAGGSEEVR